MNLLKTNIITLVTFKPSWQRFIFFTIGFLMIILGILVTNKDFYSGLFFITWGLVNLVDGGLNSKVYWDFKAPKNNTFYLYKVGNEYVATETFDEACLWAELSQIDEEPIKIGEVNQFQR